MQYFGRAIGSVSKTWNSINPATLSGAIDVIVVEDENGEMRCSPFHVRFGKFQLLRPSQKKVNVIVNGEITDIPMKLNDEGEAFFVFETDGYVPEYLRTSPVVSAKSSPSNSPRLTSNFNSNDDLEYLDIGEGANDSTILTSPKKDLIERMEDGNNNDNNDNDNNDNENNDNDKKSNESIDNPGSEPISRAGSMSPVERARSITMKLNIPSKVEANGDILLDMHGYKSDKKDIRETDILVKQLLQEEFGDDVDIDSIMNTDLEGNIRILNTEGLTPESSLPSSRLDSSSSSLPSTVSNKDSNIAESNIPSPEPLNIDESNDNINANKSFDSEGNEKNHDVHFKTLRLSSEQLKYLSLKYGENDIKYSVNNGKSVVVCKLFLWKRSTPIVISDIDGTITRSDALGHVLTMLGRDWTHEGVAKLFDDIEFNGYNIMYLTARSVGLADTTRSYLQGVEQDGYKLPKGPVILSPDRTIAALKREIVLKKPEVFKMACLNDIRTLYYADKVNPLEHDQHHILYGYETGGSEESIVNDGNNDENRGDRGDNDEDVDIEEGINDGDEEYDDSNLSEFTDINTSTDPSKQGNELLNQLEGMKLDSVVDESNTPFYAGFGNRITDAISYRSVGVPSSRIFTINPDGDVKMELLEMAGYKSNYVSIVELVDQFFPPVEIKIGKENELRNDISTSNGNSISGQMSMNNARNKYTEFNYWRNPDIDLSLISDEESDSAEGVTASDLSTSNQIRIEINDMNNNDMNKNKTDSMNRSINLQRGESIEKESLPKRSSVSSRESSEAKDNKGVNGEIEKDELKSIGSRLSYFLRSPLPSPQKEDILRGTKDRDDNNDRVSLHSDSDSRIDMDRGDEESDSDYIYETSGEEDEDEEDDEDEEEVDSEDGNDDMEKELKDLNNNDINTETYSDVNSKTTGNGNVVPPTPPIRRQSEAAINESPVLGKFV